MLHDISASRTVPNKRGKSKMSILYETDNVALMLLSIRIPTCCKTASRTSGNDRHKVSWTEGRNAIGKHCLQRVEMKRAEAANGHDAGGPPGIPDKVVAACGNCACARTTATLIRQSCRAAATTARPSANAARLSSSLVRLAWGVRGDMLSCLCIDEPDAGRGDCCVVVVARVSIMTPLPPPHPPQLTPSFLPLCFPPAHTLLRKPPPKGISIHTPHILHS